MSTPGSSYFSVFLLLFPPKETPADFETDNEATAVMRGKTENAVKNIDKDITIHDFRMVPGNTHTNLIFDVVVPYSVKLSDSQIRSLVAQVVSEECENCFTVINIDRPYV